MVFVVDDLAAWLVGLLADAGRKKLTKLVLGDAQERALQQAAIAAVQDTADELSPSDGQRAGQIAMVINQVFHAPVADAPLAGAVTLVEGLQAGIAGQLAVLDDARLTGIGQSSAEVLGMPGTVLAERLTGHLVREIMFRGSGGGPLTPLADQLNHDLTHLQVRRIELQGQRVEGMLARVAEEVWPALIQPGTGTAAAGRPLAEVTDPFALEVHRPVQLEDTQPGLSALPIYVPRGHDAELGSVVEAAAEGSSGIAVLVGESSTGKTRACWEALQLLRHRQPGWRLWHPYDPIRPEAALADLPRVGPRTVVWLNETQLYLDVPGSDAGERVAAALTTLLTDSDRSPVLILGTMWPVHWEALTRAGGPRHAQARALLEGTDIAVPTAFAGADLDRLRQASVRDPRLAAAVGAADGQATQFLAGAPALLARYRHAPAPSRAVIEAAMDARRLGCGPALPHAFLEAAAPVYLTDSEWDAAGDDWLEQALTYDTAACTGAVGMLTRIRPRPHTLDPGPDGGRAYRLADYLDQHGRAARADTFPADEFWAAARHVQPADQDMLAGAAHSRGRYQAAAQLWKDAAACGRLYSAGSLVDLMARISPGDPRAAQHAVAHAALDDPRAVAGLLGTLREVGADNQFTALANRAAEHAALDDPYGVAELLAALREAGADSQVTALLARDPASHAAPGNPFAVAKLLHSLHEAGAGSQVTALLARDPAGHATQGKPSALAKLLHALREVGAGSQVTALAHRVAEHAALNTADPVSLKNLSGVTHLLGALRWAGADSQFNVVARRAAEHGALDGPGAVAQLLYSLRWAGADSQVTDLVGEVAKRVALDDPGAVARLLAVLWEVGADSQFTALANRAAEHAALDDPYAVAELLQALWEAGADSQVTALLARDPAGHAALDNPSDVAEFLDALWEAGADSQVTALLARDLAGHVALDDPYAVAELLQALREAGADSQVTALLARDPADHAALDDLRAVIRLLKTLRRAGADSQATALANRAAEHAALNDPSAVAELLDALREMGADSQATGLTSRLHAAGGLLITPQTGAAEFRFGRATDGAPSRQWDWADLT